MLGKARLDEGVSHFLGFIDVEVHGDVHTDDELGHGHKSRRSEYGKQLKPRRTQALGERCPVSPVMRTIRRAGVKQRHHQHRDQLLMGQTNQLPGCEFLRARASSSRSMSFSVVIITAPPPLTLISASGRKHRQIHRPWKCANRYFKGVPTDDVTAGSALVRGFRQTPSGVRDDDDH